MDDGQITPRGYAHLNSYNKNLRVLVFMRQTDGQTEKLIRGGLGNYIPPGTLTACGLEEPFSKTAKKWFLQPTRIKRTWQWTCDVPLCPFFGCGRNQFLVLLMNLQYNNVGIGIWRDGTRDRCLNFNSYIQNLHFFVFQTDRWTDRQMDREIHLLCVGWRNLSNMAKKGFLQPMRSECGQSTHTINFYGFP